jgi:hypothetical protein
MGKKGSKAKKAKKYSKKEFREILCSNCSLCSGEDPSFCHEFYSKNPKEFFRCVFPKLRSLGLTGSCKKPKDFQMSDFHYAFCNSDVCLSTDPALSAKNCEAFTDCFASFKRQMSGRSGKKSKKEKKDKKKRKVYAPYPTFILSDDEEWRKRVFDILYSDENEERNSD